MKTALITMLTALLLTSFLRPVPAAESKAKKPKLPLLVTVYKTANCPWCDRLDAELKSNKVQIVGACQITKEQPVPWFPACIYSDGVTDGGERVYSKTCYFRNPVREIQWIELKDKEKP